MMTLEEIKLSRALMLSPDEVGPALGLKPQAIRDQAQMDPIKLGFRVIVCGTRVRIPRRPLLAWLMED